MKDQVEAGLRESIQALEDRARALNDRKADLHEARKFLGVMCVFIGDSPIALLEQGIFEAQVLHLGMATHAKVPHDPHHPGHECGG